ncbi:hypothetical protein, partial [Actinophytocola sp.]|uniref:hypothetical protein n=1 Tax=Actinophytocola sp. TaxID=1872138 RepID=UPI003899D868
MTLMRRLSTTTAVLAVLGTVVLGLAGAATAAPPDPTPPHVPLPAEVTIPTLAATAACDLVGTNAGDTAMANTLNPTLTKDMRGNMSAYRASCARRVVQAVRDRGLDRKAAVIAISTVIVETHLQNISEEVDHDSLGLFQQRASWGTAAQRLDPIWATNAFLGSMLSKYPNNSWMNASSDAEIGAVCQRVQVSAFPDRYASQVSDAKIIVDYLWSSSGGTHRYAVAADADDRLEMFTTGADGVPYFRYQASPGGAWSGWTSMTGKVTGLAVASNADGRLELFGTGTDGAPWHNYQTSAGGWSGWISMTGKVSGIAAVRSSDGRLELFGTGTDGAPWHNWQLTPGGAWNGWVSMTGKISGIAAISNADGRLEVFGTGTDGAPWHNYQTSAGGWSGWISMTGKISGIAALRRTDGAL